MSRSNAPKSPISAPFLSAREAAARLGVKPATLYAYVARGLLRSEVSEGGRGRGRRYAASDIEALLEQRRAPRGDERAASRALFWGAPVVTSSLAFIDGRRLFYRGLDAAELAESARFEQVAGLLFRGALAAYAPWPAAWSSPPPAVERAAEIAADAGVLGQLQLLTPVLATLDPARFDLAPAQVIATGTRILPRLVAGLALARGRNLVPGVAPGDGSLAAGLLSALGGEPTEVAIKAVDRALILSAEHELNASAFAARVAASTGADPYSVVTAALATLTGPKHGGACDRVEALVREVGTPERARPVLLERATRGEPIPVFGHVLYPEGDPRVAPLLAFAREVHAARARRGKPRGAKDGGAAPPPGHGPSLEVVLAIVDTMAAQGSPPPAMDVGLVATAAALGLPAGAASAFFAIGRAAGWIAHALEQYAIPGLIRPRARYVGPPPVGGDAPGEGASP